MLVGCFLLVAGCGSSSEQKVQKGVDDPTKAAGAKTIDQWAAASPNNGKAGEADK